MSTWGSEKRKQLLYVQLEIEASSREKYFHINKRMSMTGEENKEEFAENLKREQIQRENMQ